MRMHVQFARDRRSRRRSFGLCSRDDVVRDPLTSACAGMPECPAFSSEYQPPGRQSRCTALSEEWAGAYMAQDMGV